MEKAGASNELQRANQRRIVKKKKYCQILCLPDLMCASATAEGSAADTETADLLRSCSRCHPLVKHERYKREGGCQIVRCWIYVAECG